MSSVSTSYTSPFQISGQLGLGTVSLLGGNASNATPSAATLLSSTNTTSSSPFSVLSSTQSNAAYNQATLDALTQGKMTGSQHNVIQAIGTAAKGTYDIPWAQGTEPSVVAQLRTDGWIKLVKPTYDPATRFVTDATYQLTTVGKAIFQKANGEAATTSTSAGAPTLDSLGATNITSDQELTLTQIATSQNGTATITWPDGQEPSSLSSARQSGWVQEVLPNFDTNTSQFTSASYKLTDLGQQVYNVIVANASSASAGSSSVDITA